MYYGAFSFSVFSGILSTRFGGVRICGVGIAIMSILTILTPWVVRINFYVYMAVRVLEGIGDVSSGYIYEWIYLKIYSCFIRIPSFLIRSLKSMAKSSFACIFVPWAPPNERSKMILCAHVGYSVGSVISYPVCGFIAYRYNWENVFLITGNNTSKCFYSYLLTKGKNLTAHTLILIG